MTPEQRQGMIAGALAVLDVLTDYGGESSRALADAVRADPDTLDDDTVIRLATHVLDGSAHELTTMAEHLAAAVRMGSDYGAAFAAVQPRPPARPCERRATSSGRKPGD